MGFQGASSDQFTVNQWVAQCSFIATPTTQTSSSSSRTVWSYILTQLYSQDPSITGENRMEHKFWWPSVTYITLEQLKFTIWVYMYLCFLSKLKNQKLRYIQSIRNAYGSSTHQIPHIPQINQSCSHDLNRVDPIMPL